MENIFDIPPDEFVKYTPQDFRRIFGIGEKKSDIYYRIKEKAIKGMITQIDKPKITGPEDVFRLILPHLIQKKVEELWVLALNARNQVIKKEIIGLGIVNSTVAHPREIYKFAIDNMASAIILVHNHPSGDPTPSAADHELTRKVNATGQIIDILLLDHLIICPGKYYSFKNEGNLKD